MCGYTWNSHQSTAGRWPSVPAHWPGDWPGGTLLQFLGTSFHQIHSQQARQKPQKGMVKAQLCAVALLLIERAQAFLGPQPRIHGFQVGGAFKSGVLALASSAEQQSDPYERSLEEEMLSIATQWGGDRKDEAAERMKIRPDGPAISDRFSEWADVVTLPQAHQVYYGGEQERFFWKQNRETVHVYLPVSPEVTKQDVKFKMATKTRIFLSVAGDVVLDRELAYPVFKGNSYWYFESSEEGDKKVVVLELDKRLAFSNWPKLFPEDPDIATPPPDVSALSADQSDVMAALQAAMAANA